MSKLETILIAQAQDCLQLVDNEQLDEALCVLDSISSSLESCELQTHLSQAGATQLADMLSQAHSGASLLREDSKVKLQRLRNVRQVKAVYSASSLPQ